MAGSIVALLARRGPLASICPSEVARALAAPAQGEAVWRALMPLVREVALQLADQGQVRLTRRGQPVGAADLHQGIVRIRRGEGFERPGARRAGRPVPRLPDPTGGNEA